MDKGVERKIVYTARLEIKVENFGTAEDDLMRLVEVHKGLLEMSKIEARPGTSRSGHWRVRIPPEELTAFRKAVVKLGEPEQNQLDSQEVTEEFYDLVEQIKSQEKELESYRRLYDQAKAVPDILAVKKELDKAQQELNRSKGRHRVLLNLTGLTRVDIWLRERGAYSPEESPDFGTSVGRTFSDSVGALVQFGRGLALFATALAPWLPVCFMLALPFLVWWRRHRRKRNAKTATAQIPVLESDAPAQE